MSPLLCVPLALGALWGAPATTSPSPAVADDELPAALEPYEDALRRLGRLSGRNQRALVAQVREAVDALDTPQNRAIAALLDEAGLERDELPQPTEFGPHDPELWTGPRRSTIREGSSRWRQMQRQLVSEDDEPGRLFLAEVVYEWGSGELVIPEERERESAHFWRNALLGHHPDQDLAEALLLRTLDGDRPLGPQAHWFAHDYADLKAKAYENLPLFEVWSHAIPNDVPDVCARAFAKTCYDADLPVPLRGPHKSEWYPKIRDDALRLMRHRFAAEALAALWLQSEPQLARGYSNTINYLQAFLAASGEDFASVAERFQQDSYGFVEAIHAEIEGRGASAYQAGAARQASLAAGQQAIREAVLGVLREEGYVE